MCPPTPGYTLLELCIVLAIMAVLVSMTLPLMRDAWKEEAIWSVARDIATAAREQRHLAIETGKPRFLSVTSSGLSREETTERAVRVQTWNFIRDRWESGTVDWVFQPSGICDAFRVRIQSPYGWVEQEFSPLTATVEEEKWSFP